MTPANSARSIFEAARQHQEEGRDDEAYALCRQLSGYDEIVVDQLAEAIARDGNRMQTLVVAVVTSYPFTNRRIQAQGAQGALSNR